MPLQAQCICTLSFCKTLIGVDMHQSIHSSAVGRDLSKLTHVHLDGAEVVHRNTLRPFAGHDIGRPSPCTHIGCVQVILELSSELLAPCWTRNMVHKRPSFSLQHQSVTECTSYQKCAHNWSMDNKTCTHASSCVTHRFTCCFSRAAPKFLHLTSTPAATSQVDGPRLLCKTIAFARQLLCKLTQ